jgi:hypothetical protein
MLREVVVGKYSAVSDTTATLLSDAGMTVMGAMPAEDSRPTKSP